jgi:predicted O-methyltransferase YrrM
MTSRTIQVSDSIYEYILSVSLREPEFLLRLRKETALMPESSMQISPEQGQFMALLVKMIGAIKALEIGVYTGYSSLSIAWALPPHGRLIASDISKEWTDVAQRYWKEAGVADKIELRLAPAIDTLDKLISDGNSGSFDFVFIDADKLGYDDYYERSLQLVRPGGLITIDNTLWYGNVAAPRVNDEDTVAIRALNSKLLNDDRIELSLVPIGDGLTLALKRGR